MRFTFVTTVCMCVLVCSCAFGVELAKTPVQDAMQHSVALQSRQTDSDWGGTDDSWQKDAELRESTTGRKSLLKVGLLSALVPGGGQWYLGQRRKARYFFAAEAMTWIGYAAFRTYGNWKKDDYIRFAALHANADLEGKSDEFADFVGFYEDIDEYNTLGRAWDPDRPFLPDTPENHWRWQNSDDRSTYRDIKNRSRGFYRRSDFMVGVAIIDRLISIIDAVRAAHKANREFTIAPVGKNGPAFKLSVHPFRSCNQVCLTFYSNL